MAKTAQVTATCFHFSCLTPGDKNRYCTWSKPKRYKWLQHFFQLLLGTGAAAHFAASSSHFSAAGKGHLPLFSHVLRNSLPRADFARVSFVGNLFRIRLTTWIVPIYPRRALRVPWYIFTTASCGALIRCPAALQIVYIKRKKRNLKSKISKLGSQLCFPGGFWSSKIVENWSGHVHRLPRGRSGLHLLIAGNILAKLH